MADRQMQIDIDIYEGDRDTEADDNAPGKPKLRLVPPKK
jgi:hypothetical protein